MQTDWRMQSLKGPAAATGSASWLSIKQASKLHSHKTTDLITALYRCRIMSCNDEKKNILFVEYLVFCCSEAPECVGKVGNRIMKKEMERIRQELKNIHILVNMRPSHPDTWKAPRCECGPCTAFYPSCTSFQSSLVHWPPPRSWSEARGTSDLQERRKRDGVTSGILLWQRTFIHAVPFQSGTNIITRLFYTQEFDAFYWPAKAQKWKTR